MTQNIIFIDSRVSNYQSLIDSLTEPAEVFILDAAWDGLAQMTAYLQGRSGIDAIHLISHGSQGALYLGSTVLDSERLASYRTPLASIGSSLTESGDISLYGCNVARGDTGLQFITSLAQYTEADVAASTDATGAAAQGGIGCWSRRQVRLKHFLLCRPVTNRSYLMRVNPMAHEERPMPSL